MENGRGRKRIRKNLIIIRGLPGVGKENQARKLLYKFGSGGMYSASYYHAGYNWNKVYFSRNHMWNRRDVFRAMKEDVDPIIVYNMHYRLYDMWPFVAMGMRRGDYQISIIELPKGYPENYVSINQLYSNCLGKIPKQMFRYWEDRWQEAYDIWDVYHDSYSIDRWLYSREEWNL
ncbi:NEDD4-binding protein 2-like 1 [Salvelinus alpinus]|uniref:NEDD4-binding protein 2-like 1 isoform X1 n=1 Tax=Salvelinus alpinus TaxID=8036 RepID=UPI0039FD5516